MITYYKRIYTVEHDFRPCGFKIVYFDQNNDKEIVVNISGLVYRDKTDAENAADDYCVVYGIIAEWRS